MAILRRHPRLFGSVGFCLLVCVFTIVAFNWHKSSIASAKAHDDDGGDPPNYSLISPVESGDIAQLRKDAGLDDDALAALNLSSQDALAVVAAIRSWYENNTSSFRNARTAIADQQALIRYYQSANNNGQDVISALNTAKQGLPSLQSTYTGLLGDCRTASLTSLTNDQKTQAALMQTRAGIAMPYRVVSLSGEQDKTLQRLRMEFNLRYGSTTDPEKQSAAATQFGTDVANTLGQETLSAMQAITANIPTSSANVVNAVQTVLAVDPNQG